jgi:hypothetical protein
MKAPKRESGLTIHSSRTRFVASRLRPASRAGRLNSGVRPVTHIPANIEVDRLLTTEERSVVHWLLEHGDGENSAFLAQLEQARVSRLCTCGCASIDFSINGKRPKTFGMRVLSDYQWRSEQGHLCGAFVFEQDGLLAGLDLWSIDGQSTPDAMPPIESLVPCVTAQV